MIGSVILALALIPLVVFIWRYWRHSPWRLTVLGRNLMTQKILFAVVLIFLIISLFFPFSGAFRDIIRIVIYGALLVSFWNDVYQLLRVQRQFPHKRKKRKSM